MERLSKEDCEMIIKLAPKVKKKFKGKYSKDKYLRGITIVDALVEIAKKDLETYT